MTIAPIVLLFLASGAVLLAAALFVRARRSALHPALEAVKADRLAAAKNPERFAPALALSLRNLSLELAEAGKLAPALRAAMESSDIFRHLAHTAPESYGAMLVEAVRIEERLKKRLSAGSAEALAAILESADEKAWKGRLRAHRGAKWAIMGWGVAFWVVLFSAGIFGAVGMGLL